MIKPNVKYYFSEPFASQLERALKGHAPWKKKMEPPTEKQIYWIKKKGGTVPATKLEATKLLDKLFAKA